jgi:DNA-binding response OmpR family regulator
MNTTPTVAPPGSSPTRILLVEDNEATGRGLARLLEAQGFAVTVRNDGSSALHALDSEPPFAFLLTDLQLPDLDGREVARHAKGLDPRPLVVAITGWDIDDDPPDREAWGIDWVFTKPVDSADLIARLRSAGTRGTGGRGAEGG